MVRRRPSEAGGLPWRGVLAAVFLFAALALLPARADEIRFRAGTGVQTGTVLEEDGGTVTIRFPREAIESVAREPGIREVGTGREQAPGLEDRVRALEKKLESLPAAAAMAPPLEESGGVEGVIRWKDRPLSRGRVMIVPVEHAGRSPAAGEKTHPVVAGAPAGGGKDAAHETETDAAGRYRFERIPAGEYLLYWMPDGETGWVRRLRDVADLEVVRGGMTVLNIPEERK